jgi:hypothetical protein
MYTMKKHTGLIIILIFISIDALWAGIETTKKRTLRLEFKDELVLEAGSVPGIDRRAIFKQVAVTPDNHLVVATWNDVFLMKKHGGPLIRIGKKGPGAEYYSSVNFFSLDFSSNIYLFDGFTLHVFDKSGTFKKNIPILPKVSHVLPCIYISPTSDIFAFFRDSKTSPVKLVLEHRDISGRRAADIHSFTDKSVHVLKNMGLSTLFHEYMEDYYMVPVLNKEICFASNLVYQLHFYNPESKNHRTVKIAEKPEKISNHELNAFKDLHKSQYDRLIFPTHRPFFQGMLSDEKGRIYIIRTKPILDSDKRGRTLDVFDQQGNFLFRCYIPCIPLCIKRGRIYYIPKIKGKPSQLRLLRILNYEKIPY